jgi:hypothetical protein
MIWSFLLFGKISLNPEFKKFYLKGTTLAMFREVCIRTFCLSLLIHCVLTRNYYSILLFVSESWIFKIPLSRTNMSRHVNSTFFTFSILLNDISLYHPPYSAIYGLLMSIYDIEFTLYFFVCIFIPNIPLIYLTLPLAISQMDLHLGILRMAQLYWYYYYCKERIVI